MVKQLKNRYNDTAVNRKFILGINRAKMKVFDIKNNTTPTPQPAQTFTQTKDNFKKSKTDDWNF
jgi:hypothetical protein